MLSVGAYSAERAAALSGVPLSTVHYWARHDILVPSVAKTKPKLWSYLDLMALRVILIAPFQTQEGALGPDLREPRPHLRILPGKLGGSPHVARTRVETQSIAALARRGYTVAEIVAMYPFLDHVAVDESIELERQIDRNLAVRATA